MELQRRSIRINAPPLPLRHGQVLPTFSQDAVNCVSTKRDGKRSDTEPTTVFAASTLLTLTCPISAASYLFGRGTYQAGAYVSASMSQLFPANVLTPAGSVNATCGYGACAELMGSEASTTVVKPSSAGPHCSIAAACESRASVPKMSQAVSVSSSAER